MSRAARTRMWTFSPLIGVLFLGTASSAQQQYNYLPRGGGSYFEGQFREQLVSSIDLDIRSISAIAAVDSVDEARAIRDSLHLVFDLSHGFEPASDTVDILLRGPRYYRLDRVNRPFRRSVNVFSWDSRVVRGLGLNLDELEVCVSVGGGGDGYVPCLLQSEPPPGMPAIEAYRALLQSSLEGTLEYFVRGDDELVTEGNRDMTSVQPVEIVIPAEAEHERLELVTILRYTGPDGPQSIRRSFPIRSITSGAGLTSDR